MSKRKHSVEWMIERVKEYLDGKGSYETIAKANGIGSKTLKDWVHKYREQGETGLLERPGNAHYSSEFKRQCVEAVHSGEGSVDDIVQGQIRRLIEKPPPFSGSSFHYLFLFFPGLP